MPASCGEPNSRTRRDAPIAALGIGAGVLHDSFWDAIGVPPALGMPEKRAGAFWAGCRRKCYGEKHGMEAGLAGALLSLAGSRSGVVPPRG